MKLWASPNQAVSVSQIHKRAKDVIVRPPLGQSCFTECWLPISHHQDTPVPSPAKNFIKVSVKWTSDDRLPVILLKSLAERFPAACRAHPHPTNTGGELITPLGRRRPRSAQSSPAAAAHREPSRAEPCCAGRSAPMLRSVLLLRALSRPRGWPGGGPLLRDAPGLLLGQGRPLWAAAPPGSRGLCWAGEWRHSGGEGSPQAGRSPREAGEEGRIKPRWESAGEEGGAGIRQCWQRNVLSFSR